MKIRTSVLLDAWVKELTQKKNDSHSTISSRNCLIPLNLQQLTELQKKGKCGYLTLQASLNKGISRSFLRKVVLFGKLVAPLALLIFLIGNSFTSPISAESTLPECHYIESVPLTDQGDKPWCGPGAVVMVLQYWSVDITIEEVGSQIDPEEDGCSPHEIVEYLTTFDFKIYEFDSMDELKNWIDKDHPVIVLQWTDESKRSGHYRVVTGYDNDYGYVYINDPNGYTDKISYELFFVLWTKHAEYGVTVSPSIPFISDPYSGRTVSLDDRMTFPTEMKEGVKLVAKNGI